MIIEGNEDVSWGILDDIWFWSQNKISPNDPVATLVAFSDTYCDANIKKVQEPTKSVMGASKSHKTLEYQQNFRNLSPKSVQPQSLQTLNKFSQKSEPFLNVQ